VGVDLDEEPGLPRLLYVDSLIGPATVNTMPEGTLRAFEDHGTLKRTVDADPDGAAGGAGPAAEAGIDMNDVEQTLEDEGVTPSPSRSTSCCSR
jgi:transaldolase